MPHTTHGHPPKYNRRYIRAPTRAKSIGTSARLSAFFGNGSRLLDSPEDASEAMNLRAFIEEQDGPPKWTRLGPAFLPQRVIGHFDAIILAGRPQARDQRAGTGTIQRVAAVAALSEQLPAPAAEALDALDDWILGHGAHDRASGWRCRRPTLAAPARLDSTTGMAPNRHRATTAPDPHRIAPFLAARLSVFRSCFTAPVWTRVLVLAAGAVLAPGKRTITQALRVMGLGQDPQFRRYHEVLGRARWDLKAVARRLLLDRLLLDGPVVIGIDDTIERRWGAKIKARGIYRDPVQSSREHFVTTSGLRWLSLMVAVPISWSGRHWALPFLTVLAPSARRSEKHRKRHKTLTDWARQAILQTKRWLPDRMLIFVADSGFAALELLAAVRHHVCVITRLRLDVVLYKPAPPRRKGQRGRTPLKGRRLPTLRAVLASKQTVLKNVVVSQWYNAQQRKLLVATGTAVWYHAGIPPVPIRWVLVRHPTGEHEPAAFLSTDLEATPAMILGWFVSRWRVETTFQEVRTHLGVETQGQWSDLAILRTTPALLGLFSLITVWADDLARDAATVRRPNAAAWYRKQEPTFSDSIAAVRRVTLVPTGFINVPATGRCDRSYRRFAKSSLPDSMLRCLNCGKSSSVSSWLNLPTRTDTVGPLTIRLRVEYQSLASFYGTLAYDDGTTPKVDGTVFRRQSCDTRFGRRSAVVLLIMVTLLCPSKRSRTCRRIAAR